MRFRGFVISLTFCASLTAQPLGGTLGGILGGVPSRAPNVQPAQPSGKPPGTVSGKVVNSVNSQGIKRAVVNVTGNGFSYEATTDGSGAFRIENVEPGDGYIAVASSEDFEPSSGVRGLVKPFSVQSQQDVKDIVVQLSPHGAISGKVTDSDGDAIENAQVFAMGYNYGGGSKILRVFQSASTDDRGQYRLGNIQHGAYYLVVNARNQNVPLDTPQQHVHSQIAHEAYPETFYPSAAEPSQATPVLVKPGDEISGIDFKLAKIPAFHIRGSVANGTAGGRGGVQAQRCYNGTPLQPQGFVMTRANPDGSFDVTDAVPGSYCLTAGRPGQQNQPYGSLTVEVRDRDIDGAVIQTAPGFDLSGAVTIEGTPPSSLPRMNFTLRNPERTANAQAVVAADMTLSVKNLFPLSYVIQMPRMQSLYIKSIHLGSQDISDGTVTPVPGAPLLLTLGTDPAEIDGTIQTSNASASGFWIAVWSARYPGRNDLSQTALSNTTGAFTVQGLAPGDYKVLAIESADANDIQNLDLRAALERKAVSVTLTGGGRQTVQVTPVAADDVEAARTKIR